MLCSSLLAFVGDFCVVHKISVSRAKMDIDSLTDAIKEEYLQLEETDDSCRFALTETIPVADVKHEHADVCCIVTFCSLCHNINASCR